MSADPTRFEENQRTEARIIRGTLSVNPEVVLIAGDVGSGHWTMGALRKAGVLREGETIEEAIHRLGEKTYRSMKNNFARAGVERLLLCPGDHGLGDNDWPPGSERAQCVPYHREIFGLSFNTDGQGQWLWPATVCGVPSRPLDTKYRNTSFAVQHKNVLFVQVDIFHQEGPNDRLHRRHGSILPDVVGAHAAWLDTILAAGRADPSVRYIFVQAHTPVLPPVRAQSSSMMMAAGYDRSNLWRLMRKHRVDLYFAGEVHATTVSRDPESDLVQVVTDRNMPTRIVVCDDRLTLQCFNRGLMPGGVVRSAPLINDHVMTILKPADSEMSMIGQGVLKPLDLRRVQIHFPLDYIKPATGGSPWGSDRNQGELSVTYDARVGKHRSVDGKFRRGIELLPGSAIDVNGNGPFGVFDRTERTFSIWFRTTSKEKYNLICGSSGTAWKIAGLSQAMDLGIDAGRPFLRTSAGEISVQSESLADGLWHHAVLVVQPEARSLDDIRVYVDGTARDWDESVDRQTPIVARMSIYGISLGFTPRPVWSKSKRLQGVETFEGAIDDFAAWYRALSAEEIATLHSLGESEGLNASLVDLQLLKKLGEKSDELPWCAGGDISGLAALERQGATYRFDGRPGDMIEETQKLGWNMYRLRLFVNPSGKNLQVNDLEYTLALAERIKKAGGEILLDLHYSDTWADPGHQIRPAGWSDLDFEQLLRRVEDYSASVIKEFKRRDLLPRVVQVGNEINHGMLWPDGKLWGEGAGGWPRLAALIEAGVRGVRRPLQPEDSMAVMLHSASGGNISATQGFFGELERRGVPFDIVGLSYYPWWHGSIDDLRKNLKITAERYGKPIVLVEIGYPSRGDNWTHGATKANNAWPYTPTGQKQFIDDVVAAVRSTPNDLGRGILWWFPESIPTKGFNIWLGGRCALFNPEGDALPAAKAIGRSTK